MVKGMGSFSHHIAIGHEIKTRFMDVKIVKVYEMNANNGQMGLSNRYSIPTSSPH